MIVHPTAPLHEIGGGLFDLGKRFLRRLLWWRGLSFHFPGFNSFLGTGAALFGGHGFKGTLAADLAALASHLAHDL